MVKWGIKRRYLNMTNSRAHPTQTRSGRGVEFLVSIAGWCENHHTKVEVCSYYKHVKMKHSENMQYGPFSHILSHLFTKLWCWLLDNWHCLVNSLRTILHIYNVRLEIFSFMISLPANSFRDIYICSASAKMAEQGEVGGWTRRVQTAWSHLGSAVEMTCLTLGGPYLSF